MAQEEPHVCTLADLNVCDQMWEGVLQAFTCSSPACACRTLLITL